MQRHQILNTSIWLMTRYHRYQTGIVLHQWFNNTNGLVCSLSVCPHIISRLGLLSYNTIYTVQVMGTERVSRYNWNKTIILWKCCWNVIFVFCYRNVNISFSYIPNVKILHTSFYSKCLNCLKLTDKSFRSSPSETNSAKHVSGGVAK